MAWLEQPHFVQFMGDFFLSWHNVLTLWSIWRRNYARKWRNLKYKLDLYAYLCRGYMQYWRRASTDYVIVSVKFIKCSRFIAQNWSVIAPSNCLCPFLKLSIIFSLLKRHWLNLKIGWLLGVSITALTAY